MDEITQNGSLDGAKENAPPVAAGEASNKDSDIHAASVQDKQAVANVQPLEALKAAGFFFVRIPRVNRKPTKGPTCKGWNLPQSAGNLNGYTNDMAQVAAWLKAGDNIGLALQPSGVVSLDIDDLEETRRVFAGLGVGLDALLADLGRVEIQSGKKGKAKLLFRVSTGTILPQSKKLNFCKGKGARSIFEIRHGSKEGRTLQDVLPPSVHPDTGQPYRWVGDVRNIPPLPPALLSLWQAWPETLKTFDPGYS